MSLRTTLPEKSKFNNTASIVKMPGDLDVEVELILNDDGSYNFKIPFLVDMREAIKKKVKLIVEITDGSNPEPMGIVDINTRSIDTKTLDKLNMLPGQENNNSGFVKRMKARNEEKELELSATKSGKVMSGKSSFESSKRSINLLGQNNDIGESKDRLIKKSLLLHSVRNSKKLRYDKLTTNKTKIKKRYQIDYTSNISNEVVLNIDNLTDLQAFGLKDMYYLGYPDNPGHDATSRISFTPRSLPAVSAPKVSIGSSIQNSVSIKEKPKTARKSINQLYIKGIDPAASFEGLQTHRSP
ncbi:MAG TPA: hypothetical protein DF712_03125, partial [Balneola sp.]|nr:hypothetical protein [Balneola sp.]